MVQSLGPVAEKDARLLILGSMPGKVSLEKQQYYAHPRNAFWKILFRHYGLDEREDYAARKDLVLEHGIALWDVLASCEREGSLDSGIRNGQPNDLIGFLKEHPEIRVIGCNGRKAHDSVIRWFGLEGLGRELILLPSTSPAHAAMKFEEKLAVWSACLDRGINP